MTTPFLLADLKADEGLRLKAYPDPISKGAPWTIGYGHTGPEVKAGLVWTDEQCETALRADVAEVCAQLDRHIPWWRNLSDIRQDVLANMAFNMGWGGLAGFARTLGFIEAGAYARAAANMRLSLWARQVGERALRLADQMETGVRAPRPGDPPVAAPGAPARTAEIVPLPTKPAPWWKRVIPNLKP